MEKEKLNPVVRYSVFFHDSAGSVFGLVAAIELLKRFAAPSIRVWSLPEGASYREKEPVMVIEGHVQDLIVLETVLLGIISSQTTRAHDKDGVDLVDVEKRFLEIVSLVGNRPVLYMGARHWHFSEDKAITQAALRGGASGSATAIGLPSEIKPTGTIPHALECVFAWKYGMDRAVVESVLAFDRHIDPSVPRIALVDFRNYEIDDSLGAAKALGDKLFGIRIDTAGENIVQGSVLFMHQMGSAHWHGTGVTVSGVYAVRKALDSAGFQDVNIVLTSGFGDPKKVRVFVHAEKELGMRLFDMLGVGKVFPTRAATLDIIGIGDSRETIMPLSKTGRIHKENPRLQRVL